MPNPHSRNLPDAQFFPQYHDDEISLVDLAKILIRRRWWVIGVSGVIFFLSVAFVLLSNQTYQMITVYRASEEAIGKPLEAPGSLIQKIQNLYWPAVEREYLVEHHQKTMPYDLRVTNPANTSLIVLTTSATAAEHSVIEGLHRDVLSELVAEQAADMQVRMQRLGRQLENTRHLLSSAQEADTPAAAEIINAYSTRIFELEDRLEGYKAGAVLQYAAQGSLAGKLKPSLILILGAFLALFLGMVSAFFAEFIGRIRQSFKEDELELS